MQIAPLRLMLSYISRPPLSLSIMTFHLRGVCTPRCNYSKRAKNKTILIHVQWAVRLGCYQWSCSWAISPWKLNKNIDWAEWSSLQSVVRSEISGWMIEMCSFLHLLAIHCSFSTLGSAWPAGAHYGSVSYGAMFFFPSCCWRVLWGKNTLELVYCD